MSDDKTTLISLRVPKVLLEQFDALVRERAYREGQRVTRNATLVELIESAVQKQTAPPTLLIDHPPEYERESDE